MVKSKTNLIKGKPYAYVGERLHQFRSKYPIDENWSLISEIVECNENKVLIRAQIVSPTGKVVATGCAEEQRTGNINRVSAVENCETSAWGRALASAGFAPDGRIASYEEMKSAMIAQETFFKDRLERYGLTEANAHRWCMANHMGPWDELEDKEKEKIVMDLKDGVLLVEDVREAKTLDQRVEEMIKLNAEERKKGIKREHDPNFKPVMFAVALKDLGYELDAISAFCQTMSYGRPSSWTENNRKRFLKRLKAGELETMPPRICNVKEPTKVKK